MPSFFSPACFAGEITPDQVCHIRFGNESQRAAWREILDYAGSHALHGDWLDAMKECLRYDEKGVVGRAVAHLARGDLRLLSEKIGRKLRPR